MKPPSGAASVTGPRMLGMGLVAALLGWITVSATLGTVLALQVLGLPLAEETPRNFSTPEMVWAAAIVAVACLAAAVVTRLIRKELTLPATLATSGAIILAGSVATGSVAALALIVVAFAVAWLLGSALLRRLPANCDVPIVRFPLAIALGLGVLGLGFFLLAAFSLLSAVSAVIVVCLLLIVALAGDRGGLRTDVGTMRRWQVTAPTWFETVIFALAAGLVTFATLTAFVPEIQTDATREHLPIAREIWQSGGIGVFVPMGVSSDPVQGHLFYAVAYGFGGSTAATLAQTFAGLTAFTGVAALGWLVSGRVAAICGAAIFATMPMVLWQLGHAFIDLFPVLFMVTAASCILLWQRDGHVPWLIAAGALAGVGFACKVTMGWSIAGLLAGLVLVGRAPWQWRGRVIAAVGFGIGTLVVVPWLIRGYLVTGDIIGAGTLIRLLDGVAPDLAAALRTEAPAGPPFILDTAAQEATAAYLDQRGLGHSPLAFLRAPWELTFHGDRFRFPLIGRGEIGISLLMLLPLALIGPRTRATAFLSVAAFVSYAIWFLTPYQIARHLLPTLAIASALAGIGVASVLASPPTTWTRALAGAARVGLIVGCLAVPFLLLPSARATLPVGLFLATESTEAYIQRAVPSATALTASSELLPHDAPVAYVGGIWEGPQLYTEARLVYVVPDRLGTTAEEILGNLDRLGVRHFIWNRADSFPADWRSAFLSADFLEHHTRILAGDRDAYLFEILPESDHRWGADTPGNLLGDPSFATVRKGNGPWNTTERTDVDEGIVTLRRRGTITQQVPVTGGAPYLMTVSGKCAEPGDRVELSLQWLQADGAVLGTATERVLPGVEGGSQFLWRRAPEDAATVVATVGAIGSASCQFDGIALHEAV